MRNLAPLPVVLALAAAGCSEDTATYPAFQQDSDVSTVADAADATDDGTQPSDAESDAAIADTGVPHDATVVPDPATNVSGGVTLLEVRSPDFSDLESGGLGAALVSNAAGPSAPVAVVGPCEIRSTEGSDDLLQAGPSLDAGTITIETNGQRYLLAHDGDGYAAETTDDAIEFFNAGETVTFAADGGTNVGSFGGGLIAPEAPSITAPEWGPFEALDRDEPLDIAWDGGPAGALFISLVPVTMIPEPGVAEGNAITCTVPDTGRYTVPVEALEYLPEGDMMGGLTIALTVVRTANADAELPNAAGTAVLNVTAAEISVGSLE